MYRHFTLKKLNNHGVALIVSYFALTVLLLLMAGFAISTVSELKMATVYRNSAAAFWIAEAGINKFIQNTHLLDSATSQTYYYDANYLPTATVTATYVTVSKDTSDSTQLVITGTGRVNGITRKVQIVFPANPPSLFSNTISSGGNMTLNGFIANMVVNGKTRLTGTFSKSSLSAATFEDKQENVAVSSTTLKYPDSNANGTAEEFNDFVQFNRNLVSTYPPSEVVYIQSNNTQLIYPNQQLAGKKIIYVEGTAAGSGNVNILFDASWQNNQNLTVISTGAVNYIQPLQLASTSQLNFISWSGYNEGSILYGAHNGVTYTHNNADYASVFSYSVTTGNIIANGGMTANETLSWKQFEYGNPISGGKVPPGFEGLVTASSAGYSSTPQSWQEL